MVEQLLNNFGSDNEKKYQGWVIIRGLRSWTCLLPYCLGEEDCSASGGIWRKCAWEHKRKAILSWRDCPSFIAQIYQCIYFEHEFLIDFCHILLFSTKKFKHHYSRTKMKSKQECIRWNKWKTAVMKNKSSCPNSIQCNTILLILTIRFENTFKYDKMSKSADD